MNNFTIRIDVEEGKVKEILDRLTEAQEVIWNCYNELRALGVIHITEKADS